MAKMFYSAEETTAKLNVTADQLKELVTQNKLREFRDGNRVMFKVDQVDRVAGAMQGGTLDQGAIELAPLSGTGNPILNANEATAGGTAISSAAGQSTAGFSSAESAVGSAPHTEKRPMRVFDESEVKPTDASAQTQISSPLDESISPSGLDSVGSGSGLLDLTRESDNTSLGAELLEEIYPADHTSAGQSGTGSSSGIFDQAAGSPAAGSIASSDVGMSSPGSVTMGRTAESSVQSTAPTFAPMFEAADASSGLFGGLALGSAFVMVMTLIAAAAAFQGFVPTWVPFLAKNVLMLILFLVVISALLAFAGYLAGKASD